MYMGLMGDKNMQNQELRDLYKELLSQNWKGKQVWEHMCAHVLTAAPHFVGDDYKDDYKLMVVGRAVNGWKVNFEKCRKPCLKEGLLKEPDM